MYTASGLIVRFLKVFEKSNYTSIKWVRYLTKASGSYQVRVCVFLFLLCVVWPTVFFLYSFDFYIGLASVLYIILCNTLSDKLQ